jgi:guanidinoacetate N-methyltransferase
MASIITEEKILSRGPRNKNLPDFPEKREDWINAKAEVSGGKLEILQHPVMEDWEAPYMAELAKVATRNGGNILEIGYGLGLSASFIQEQNIYRHYVIEANHDVFLQLVEFSKTANSTVIPIFGFWQDVVPQFQSDSFDGILYDPYPTHYDEYVAGDFNFIFHAQRLLKPGGLFTYYTCIENSSADYIDMAKDAGFRGCTGYKIDVAPPKDCKYWGRNEIFVPTLTK